MIRVITMEIECASCKGKDARFATTRKQMTEMMIRAGWARILGQWHCPVCRDAAGAAPERDMEAGR